MRFEVSADRAALVRCVAVELLATVNTLQARQETVNLMLTGGSVALEIYEECATLMAQPVAMPGLHIWWGDERFVAPDDDQRNDAPAMQALRRAWELNPDQIHPMGSPHEFADAEAAAEAYQEELGDQTIDLCLLGMGPDGHVASVFPDHAGFAPSGPEVMAVTDSPKPPPVRLSLSIERLNQSTRMWFLVSGREKAEAVAEAITGRSDLPAGVARGTDDTTWWLDADAAAELPGADEDTIAIRAGSA